MNPYHLSILFQFCDTLCESTVDIDVSLPEFLSSQVILEVIQAFKVMEERPQDGLMEIQKLLDRGLVEKDGDTSVILEDVSDFLGFPVVLRDDTRPSNPDDLDHLPLFSKFKHCRI